MNTILQNSIASALFSETRLSVLSLLFGNADQAFYLRQISRTTGSALQAVQREVKNLSEAWIIKRTVIGRHVYYQASSDCLIFSELKSIVIKLR